MTARFRTNPLSFVRGRDLVFQYRGKLRGVRLDPALWETLGRFYDTPTLAPRPKAVDFDPEPLLDAGILIAETDEGAFLRAERRVLWMPDKSTIHLMLAATESGTATWFEHTGHCPLLFFRRATDARDRARLFTYDGLSFGFESLACSALADDKAAANAFLKSEDYPVPSQVMVATASIPRRATATQRRSFIILALLNRPTGLRFPVVVKPVNLSLGRGVEFAADEDQLARRLIASARAFPGSRAFVIETAVPGREWRCTVFADGSHAAYERTPFRIVGDGRATIRELIARQHELRRRIVQRRGYLRPPAKLHVGAREKRMLTSQHLTLDSIPARGRRPALVERPHASLGGIYRDATRSVPSEIVEMLQCIREKMGLVRAGFDLIGRSFTKELHILEVNSRPNLWTHIEPDVGAARAAAVTMVNLGFERALDEHTARSLLDTCRSARAF